MKRTAVFCLLAALCLVLSGCTHPRAEENVIEITYPANTLVAAAAPEITAAPEMTAAPETTAVPESVSRTYVLNKNTKKFHYPTCSSVATIKEKNREEFTGDRAEVIARGFSACKRCDP